ncbi:MAG TPA: translation initiation factor eIF-1A [Methanothrix sp.]|jgi:translation initiation factor 1A|nr:MAG: Translation initiation factor 1A [Methanosaeta sp. PtaU1.Bin055]HQA63084.1 translation initiation factor eIF-1A [Methanothrix sp.]
MSDLKLDSFSRGDILANYASTKRKREAQGPEIVTRVRLPRSHDREVFGYVESLLGSNRLKVRCLDGKERMARIPGKMKKRIWIREGDVVIVIPWEFQDEKADVVWRYTGPQVDYLERKGFLKR